MQLLLFAILANIITVVIIMFVIISLISQNDMEIDTTICVTGVNLNYSQYEMSTFGPYCGDNIFSGLCDSFINEKNTYVQIKTETRDNLTCGSLESSTDNFYTILGFNLDSNMKEFSTFGPYNKYKLENALCFSYLDENVSYVMLLNPGVEYMESMCT